VGDGRTRLFCIVSPYLYRRAVRRRRDGAGLRHPLSFSCLSATNRSPSPSSVPGRNKCSIQVCFPEPPVLQSFVMTPGQLHAAMPAFRGRTLGVRPPCKNRRLLLDMWQSLVELELVRDVAEWVFRV
jgi:hypothetical protein